MFAVRKTVEIATQVPNGYLYSTLIARAWINHAKVALLVVNCWSAFLIHQRLVNDEPVGRRVVPSRSTHPRRAVHFSAVVVDALLATATGVLLPSAIFLPYLLQFDMENLDFPDSLLYGDTEFPNLVLENRAFFAISWANAAMKGVPHVSTFLCLLAIASMLDAASSTNPAPPVSRSPPRIGIKRSSVDTATYRVLMQATHAVQRPARLVQRVHRVAAPLLFLATGAIVLALHLAAQYGRVDGAVDAMEGACLQRMHPWLTANFSCAVVKYNCHREGVATPAVDALARLEREAVRNIIFMNCPAFVMPPTIVEFPFLMGVELWNSTLVSWGEEAALSAQLHPMMLFLVFAFVNMSGLPQGILQPPLPIQLTDIELSHTNITVLPDQVAQSWANVELVYVEHSELNPFPSVLLRLPVLSELSLIDNKFESMPADSLLAAASTYFSDLALSQNPLQTLPEARNRDFDVSYLALEYTQLTELPAWVSSQVGDSVSLGGSPVCDSDSPELALCGQDEGAWDPLGAERYPTEFIKRSRLFEE